MKNFFSLIAALLFTETLLAQVSSGYYRVQNNTTGRYLYVYDTKGEARLDGIDVKVDLDAIYLRADLENAISDPASIIYVDNRGNNVYDFRAQGTSVHQIIDNYVSLNERNGHFAVGATLHGVSKYLTDKKTTSNTGYGIISTEGNAKFWDAIPVSSSTSNYFGIAPSLDTNNKYYGTFFASFGIKPTSSSTKLYYVSDVSDCAVLLSEITSSVSSETPIIVESESPNASSNKFDVIDGGSSPSDNKLRGVYFNTDNSDASYAVKVHVNQTKSDSSTRVLDVDSDGNLVFTNSCPTYLSANSAYLKVGSTANAILRVCFTQEEFENASVLDKVESNSANLEVFNVLGKKVTNNGNLPAGIYIIGGKKTVIR